MNQPSLFGDDAPAHEPPKSRPGRTKRAVRPLPECFAEPVTRSQLWPDWYRTMGARELLEEAAKFEAREVSEDEFYRYLRGSLYMLTKAELVELAKWLADKLRGNET